ncbi:MAG: CrcB family protein [Ilumatobacteraceae bacterium]
MTTLWFVLAAAGGGLGRHLITERCAGRWLATAAVNVIGSFVLGVVLRHDPSDDVLWVVGTAACGSFTTFGGFVVHALDGSPSRRRLVVVVNVGGSVGAAALGWWLG